MSSDRIIELKALKEKFKSLTSKERESLGVSLLKVKLGVHAPAELSAVRDFFGPFKIDYTPENLDHIIEYFHSTDQSLPEFFALEDSLSQTTDSELSPYSEEDVETLKDKHKPFDE